MADDGQPVLDDPVLDRFGEYVKLGVLTIFITLLVVCFAILFVLTLPITVPFALLGYLADKIFEYIFDEPLIEEEDSDGDTD